jgi:hypothetical protein
VFPVIGIIIGRIDTDPSTTRCQQMPVNPDAVDYLVIGGSHARRTSEQMKKRGLDVQVLHLPSYRASSVHAGKLTECLETVKIGPGTVIVLQIFDNGVYMVNTNEGGYLPMHKSLNGNFHAIGELEVVPKDLQWRLFDQVQPARHLVTPSKIPGEPVLQPEGPYDKHEKGRL